MSPTPPHAQVVTELVRRIFPAARTLQVARVEMGVSTWVYAIHLNDARYYLRVLPEAHASFAPEAYVHAQLFAAGLHVPEVVYFEHDNELLARSVMVTTEIHGAPLAHDAVPDLMAAVLRAAGRELALLNQMTVAGFGWIERTQIERTGAMTQRLSGEYSTFRAWIKEEVASALPMLAAQAWLARPEMALLARHLSSAVERFDTAQATLAHGDFDLTHIFHDGGRYSGMIDFGEIRGAHQLYDLGHFAIEQGHLLTALLEGYGEITPLPDDYATQIEQAALLVAIARVARRVARQRSVLAADRQVILSTLGKLPLS